MPRIENFNAKGPGGASSYGSERAIVDEVVEMTVFETDATLFEAFVEETWSFYNMKWGAIHNGAPLPVTLEELVKYAYTALKARVCRVRNERFHIRCDAPWQLPATFANAINGIGRVTLEAPVVTLLPKWNSDFDMFILDVPEWHRITQRLRAVGADPEAKITLVKAIAGDPTGDENMMNLVPVRDEQGRIQQLRSTHTVDATAALVYLISGFAPQVYDGLALNTHPLTLPPYYIRTAALLHYLYGYVEAA